MKKIMKRVLSFMLVATLVVSYSGVASASGIEKAPKSIKTSATAVATKAAILENKVSIPTITPSSGPADVPSSVITYSRSNAASFANDKKGFVQRVYLSKGVLVMAARAYSNDGNGSVAFGLYKDANLTTSVGNPGFNYPKDENTTSRMVQVPKAGYYYVGITSRISEYSTSHTYSVAFAATFANGSDRTITSGKSIAVGQYSSQTNYFKFKAKSTGYIKVSKDGYNAKIALTNSKKKALTKYITGKSVYYGVKKGTTYYIKINAYSNPDGGYVLKVTNSAIKEKSGSKKSKAATMAYKKYKNGTIIAGSSQSDYYKFKVPKKKKVKIVLKGRTNERINVKVYKGKKVIGSSNLYSSNSGLTLKSSGKLTPGTYYVKVSRGTKYSSGYYKMYWKYY